MQTSIKTALITGASRGLGKSLAQELARHGVQLTLTSRHKTEIDAVVDEINSHGGQAIGVVADIADKQSIYPLVGRAHAAWGAVDLLINNASTLGDLPMRPLLDGSCENLQDVLEANLIGPYRLIKAVAGSMILAKSGVILNISSDAAVAHYETWGPYGLSKAALAHLTQTLEAETSGSGVTFLSIDPGEMNTRMHEDAMPDADKATLQNPEFVARKLVAAIMQERASHV